MSLRLTLSGLGALFLFTSSIAAAPSPDNNQLRARTHLEAREALTRLQKRLTQCSTGLYCQTGTTCCGIYCCFSSQSCYSDLFCTTYDLDLSPDISISPTATASAVRAARTSDSFFSGSSESPSPTSSYSSSTSTKKCSSFSCWSTGAKVGAILGPIIGVSLLAALITFISCMTCCKNRNKPQKVGQGGVPAPAQYQAAAAPPVQPVMAQQHAPAPPYAPQGQGGISPMHTGQQQHMDAGAYQQQQEHYKPPEPTYNDNTGGYMDGQKNHVFEAPESTRQ